MCDSSFIQYILHNNVWISTSLYCFELEDRGNVNGGIYISQLFNNDDYSI